MTNVIERIKDYDIVREHGLYDKPKQKSLIVAYHGDRYVASGTQSTVHKGVNRDMWIRQQRERAEIARAAQQGN